MTYEHSLSTSTLVELLKTDSELSASLIGVIADRLEEQDAQIAAYELDGDDADGQLADLERTIAVLRRGTEVSGRILDAREEQIRDLNATITSLKKKIENSERVIEIMSDLLDALEEECSTVDLSAIG